MFGGRYRLVALIGVGGMGQVFAARDVLLDRPVAVKLPSTPSTSASERFRREARAAASLNHPNVVSVYDWGEDANGPFLVMELVDGHSLRDVLHTRHTLPPARSQRIGDEIAGRARTRGTPNGVVHRDVKPSNLLVTDAGEVKVTDFGISKSSSAEALTEPGVVVGTPGYLAPEQAAGLVADARTRRVLAGRRAHRAAHRHARWRARPERLRAGTRRHARRARRIPPLAIERG